MKPRPFGLADAMLLVVAAATGLWLNRVELHWLGVEFFWNTDPYNKTQLILSLVLPYVAVGTAALLGMRLRQPHPPLRRLARQPGAVACMVASAVLLVTVGWVATTMATGHIVEFSQFITPVPFKGGGHGRGGTFYYPGGRMLVVYGDRVGFAVAGAWLSLLLSGHWRPERTWIDRLGRAMGWLWLGLTAVLWVRGFLL